MDSLKQLHCRIFGPVTVIVALTAGHVRAGGLTGFNWIGGEMSGSMGNTTGTIEYDFDSSLNGASGISFARWKAAINSSLGQWSNWTRLNFAVDDLFTDNDILFIGADLGGVVDGSITLADTTPMVGGNCGGAWSNPLDDICIRFNTNAALNWSDDGTAGTRDIGAVALHEIGHAMGLAHTNKPEGYNNHNSVPVPNGGGYYPWAHATADNVPVMAQGIHSQTNGLVLTDDDIAMARWIYGSSRSPSLINANWGSIDDNAPWIMQTLPAHGPSNAGVWVYSGTIESPFPDSIPFVQLDAGTNQGVTEVGDNFGGWSCTIHDTDTSCLGPVGLKGNFQLTLKSTMPEGVIDWHIGGVEAFTGKTFGPTPEPSTLSLLALTLLLRSRRRA